MRYNHFDLLPEAAFRTLDGRKPLTLEGGKSSPPAPDYKGAAEATAAGDLEATRVATAANRVNQYGPYGSIEYTHNPTGTLNEAAYNSALESYNKQMAAYAENPQLFSTTGAPKAPNIADFYSGNYDDGWSMTTSLSPEQQAIYDKNMNLSQGFLDTAQTGLGYVDSALSTGGALDESRLAQPGISGQAVQDAIMSRLAPQLARDQESLRTRLANQGLMEGSEAWQNAMTDQGQHENDLYTQAALQGINTANQSRAQGIQEQYAAQDRPLNIVNALRTGNQVSLPQFNSAIPQQAATQGADMLGAAVAQGNYDSAQAAAARSGFNSTLGNVGSVASAYFL